MPTLNQAFVSSSQHRLMSAPAQKAGAITFGDEIGSLSVRDKFRAADADFDLEFRPIQYQSSNGELITHRKNNHRLVVRKDNDALLGVVGARYQFAPQNDMIRFFEYLREDANITNILTLDGGAVVVVSAEMNIQADILPGDTVKRYLHLTNTHNGKGSWTLNFSDVRLFCMNQFAFITQEHNREAVSNGQGVRWRHSTSILENVRALPQLIDVTTQSFIKSAADYQRMVGAKLSTVSCQAILKETYKDQLSGFITDKHTGERREKNLNDLEEHYIAPIRRNFCGETGIAIDPDARDAWSLFNAITQFETHQSPTRSKNDVTAARRRLEALWGGRSAERIERAKNAILATV